MRDLSNSGKPWSDDEERRLAGLLSAGLTITELAILLRRTETAIRDKRQELTRRAQGRLSRYAVRRESPLVRVAH